LYYFHVPPDRHSSEATQDYAQYDDLFQSWTESLIGRSDPTISVIAMEEGQLRHC
jgi:hypothetical protein